MALVSISNLTRIFDVSKPWLNRLIERKPKALLTAGVAHVFLGEPEAWRSWTARADFEGLGNVSLLPLDVTDVSSIDRLSAEIGGKVDILINTASFVRPGGVMGQDAVFAKDAFEVNTIGFMRLAQGFGTGMAARAQDQIGRASRRGRG